MELKDTTKKEDELLIAVKKGVTGTTEIVDEMGNRLMECARLLRVEQSEMVFTALSEEIDNISQLVEFIKELKGGLGHLKGINIPPETFSCWDNSVGLFKEMLSAFEGKDWITLADLIEYELNPLFLEGKKGLSELNERLMAS